jgi:deoxyribonuclease-1
VFFRKPLVSLPLDTKDRGDFMRLNLYLFLGLFSFQLTWAGPKDSASLAEYYGTDFEQAYQSGRLRDEELISTLNQILAKNHRVLGYDSARRHLFGKLFLEQVAGAWAVKDVYCERTYTNRELAIGPGQIPDGNVVNTEHTWPQSRFTGRYPKEMQKSDLHHLFPTDNQMNSHRSSLRFGDVRQSTERLKCPIAQLGHHHQSNEIVFEAPRAHKGNVARAIFYFAVRYQMRLSPTEEADLRKWHEQDPVDSQEAAQNSEIQGIQGNRNPFIDYPEMTRKIRSFTVGGSLPCFNPKRNCSSAAHLKSENVSNSDLR